MMASPIQVFFDVSGIEALEADLARIQGKYEGDNLEEAVTAGALVVEEIAPGRAPKRSGKGAESITHMTKEKSKDSCLVLVGPTRFYMGFQEKGTKHHGARPFLRPTIRENKEQIVAAVKARLKS
jgi:HK97 gp10 family phage protein